MSEASPCAWEKENVKGMAAPQRDAFMKPVESVCSSLHRVALPFAAFGL